MFLFKLLAIFFIIINTSVYGQVDDDDIGWLDLDEGDVMIYKDDTMADMYSSSNSTPVPDNYRCVIIYIPEEILEHEDKEFSMILFVNNNPSYGESRDDYSTFENDDFFISKSIRYGDETGQYIKYPATIREGKKIFLNSVFSGRIILDNSFHHVCSFFYENREFKVLDESNNVIGYVYKSQRLNVVNFGDYKLDDFVRFAAKLVVSDEIRFRKRSKYLFSCITGENNIFGNYRCYELAEKNSRKAYVKKPYKLVSTTNRMQLIVQKRKTVWMYQKIKYFHPYIRPEEVSPFSYSTCYYKHRSMNVFGGRLIYLSDSDRQAVKGFTSEQIKAYINSLNFNAPDC